MYLFEYNNEKVCIVIKKIIAVVHEQQTKVSITLEQIKDVVTFGFNTEEEANNMFTELVRAIQDFYAE